VIRDRINRLEVAVTKARRDSPLGAVQGGIEQAKTAARLNGKGIGPTDWLGQSITGSAIEAAWRGLHLAEEEFVLHAQEDWVLERLSETQQALHVLGILGPGATAAQKVVLETKADGLGKDERQALKATLGALKSSLG
jgi:hypothetical protein